MKIFLFFLITVFSAPLFGQTLPIDEKTGKVAYQEVVNVNIDKNSKTDLYLKGKEWIATTFKSANDVIQMDDKEGGIIIGKGVIKIDPTCEVCGASGIHKTQSGFIEFTFKIEFKDGRYRYEFTNFNHKADNSGGNLENAKPDCGGMSMTKKAWESIKGQFDTKITEAINGLKESMLSKSSNNDW